MTASKCLCILSPPSGLCFILATLCLECITGLHIGTLDLIFPSPSLCQGLSLMPLFLSDIHLLPNLHWLLLHLTWTPFQVSFNCLMQYLIFLCSSPRCALCFSLGFTGFLSLHSSLFLLHSKDFSSLSPLLIKVLHISKVPFHKGFFAGPNLTELGFLLEFVPDDSVFYCSCLCSRHVSHGAE